MHNGWMRNAGRKINLIAILSFLFCNISFSQIIPDSIYGNRPKYMMHYDKKIIRHIYILNELVPLKSNPKQKKIIKKAARAAQVCLDALHHNSRIKRLRNYVLINEGEVTTTERLLETERILRSFSFLEDAILKIINVTGTDSIDVYVNTSDIFSIRPSLRYNNLKDFTVGLTEENFLGTTNQFGLALNYDHNAGIKLKPGITFTLRNPFSEFTNFTVQLSTFGSNIATGERNEISYGAGFYRPFLSNIFEWDGGLSYARIFADNYFKDTSFIKKSYYDSQLWDIWLGYNNKFLRKFKLLGQYRSVYLAARAYSRDFSKTPLDFAQNLEFQFIQNKFILFQASLFHRSFYRVTHMFDLGRPEDIEIGSNLTIRAGPSWRSGIRETYLGTDIQLNHMLKDDVFLDINAAIGGFRKNDKLNDLSGYFSALFVPAKQEYRKFYWRNYFSLSYSTIANQEFHPLITVRNERGLLNYGRSDFRGTSRTALLAESQFFFKRTIFGFSIAPLINTQLALLHSKNTGEAQVHTSFGVGIRFRNPRLAFNAFDIRGFLFPRLIESSGGFGINITSRYYLKKNIQLIQRPEILIL